MIEIPAPGATAAAPTEAGLHTWSLVDGTYAWCLATPSGFSTGTVTGCHAGDFAIAILTALKPHLGPGTCLAAYGRSPVPARIHLACRRDRHFEPARIHTARTLAIRACAYLNARFAGQLTRLLCLTCFEPSNPPAPCPAPFVVATDASVRTRTQAWAYVTAGGWYDTGPITNLNVNVAELAAQIAALQVIPAQADVTVITDSASSVSAWATARATEIQPWIPKSMAGGMRDHLSRLGRITVEHHPRNTHPLQHAAHFLATAASSGLTAPARRNPHAIYRAAPRRPRPHLTAAAPR